MRIAFVGKGGAGKSAIAGCLARLLARAGHPVLAVDSDPLPGLSLSLGLGVTDVAIPDEAVEQRPEGEAGPRYRLRAGLSAAAAIERYALAAPDNVRYLQFGKTRGPVGGLVRAQSAFRGITDELAAQSWTVVGDLPGGTRQAFLGWARYAETLIVVAEPTGAGILSARRLARLAGTEDGPLRVVAVANKVRDTSEVHTMAERTGLPVLGHVPWDAQLRSAEQEGRSLLDHAPRSAAAAAITELADRLAEDQPAAPAPATHTTGVQ